MKRAMGTRSWIAVVVVLAAAATLVQLQRGSAKDPPNRACMAAAEVACREKVQEVCGKKKGPAKALCESTTKDACLAEARKRC